MQQTKRPSVKDIAARLHISLSTVHKALTGKPGISEARRSQILAVAEEMGYVVNTCAQSLSRKSFHLGILIPSQWQDFFRQMEAGITSQLAAMEEHRLTGSFYTLPPEWDSSQNEILHLWLRDNKIDAVLYCASSNRYNTLMASVLPKEKLPIFWVGGSADIPFSIANITVDADLTGKLAADFLCAAGGRLIKAAVFTGSMDNPIHKQKVDAFCRRMEDNGGTVLQIVQTEDLPHRAEAAVAALLEAHPEVTDLYISTSTSLPICRFLQEQSLAGKIRLLGTDLFDALLPYIAGHVMQATISQNPEEVGKLAVSAAYEYLHKTSSYGNADWTPRRQLLVKPSILFKANLE